MRPSEKGGRALTQRLDASLPVRMLVDEAVRALGIGE
jgi:hypothetical protein